MALGRKTEKMPISQKDQNAAEAIDRWQDFQESLASLKRKLGSCLSTVTTNGCGFVFERESVKADIEWVG